MKKPCDENQGLFHFLHLKLKIEMHREFFGKLYFQFRLSLCSKIIHLSGDIFRLSTQVVDKICEPVFQISSSVSNFLPGCRPFIRRKENAQQKTRPESSQ